MSPTQRSLKWCRDKGWTAQKVEHWNAFARRRVDLLGFGDIIALNGTITAIQATSGDNVAHRVNKLLALPSLSKWLESGGRCEVHGWRKAGARGKRKLWSLRRVVLVRRSSGDMEAEQA